MNALSSARPQAPGAAEIPADDERALVARIRAGDEQAFEQVFLNYYRRLYTFVVGYVHSRALAEDVVQDLLMHVWRHRETWGVNRSLSTYLFGAARNRALNSVRDERLASRRDLAAGSEIAAPGMGQQPVRVDTPLLQNELRAAFARAEDKLPDRQRQAFALRWRAQLSHAEIAEVMGVSVKAVEINLSRAFKTIRGDLAAYL